MHKAERIILYTLTAAACMLGLRAGLPGTGSPAAAGITAPPAPADQPATRLATCDVFGLVERLIETEPYFVPRKHEEDRIKSELMPLQTTLQELQTALQGADMKKPENIAKQNEGKTKYEEYQKLSRSARDDYGAFVAKQFVAAHEKVHDAIARTAKAHGFTHVAAQKGGAIQPIGDAQKLAEEFLARPYSVQPEGSDITEATRLELGLPEKVSGESPLLGKPDAAKPTEPKP